MKVLSAEEKALRIYVEKLEKENDLLRRLSSTTGFYQEYYKKLASAKSNEAAFNDLNETYHKLFGRYRYSDFNSFKRVTHYYNKKK
ncbi:hypothetical protein [uncultured Flavobacterium sp.]|uniref:hypothetical protein n=1 Tax=uncultured Flavobacterium sp. TaxID=165435 RepID=UPI0025FB15A7|nr:hypothetical protein [uncultured Flavobacterium sp.]